MSNVLTALVKAAAVILLALLCRRFCFMLALVSGTSMLDTLRNHDVLIVRRLGDIRRGDIVICHFPNRRNRSFPHFKTCFVKRVIGLPGETVSVQDGIVMINDRPLDESYLSANRINQHAQLQPVALADDAYFLMGDNRRSSIDSRRVGPIKRREVLGVASVIAFPFKRAKKL